MRRVLALAFILAALAMPASASVPQHDKKSEPAHPSAAASGEYPNLAGYTDAEKQEISRQARVWYARYCAARGDILGWGFALFPEKFTVDFCPELHQYLVDIRHEPFASTEAPRNHAKTTIKCFLIPIYQALNEPETFQHYLNVQATDEKALSINTTIKTEIDENPLLREIYGDVRNMNRWTNGQFVVRVKKGDRVHEIVFTAKSAGQSLRGINYNSKRPDYILTDDLYNENDYYSKEQTEQKNAWFDGALMYARAKTKASCVHLLGTAANVYDKLELNKRNAKACKFTDVKDAKPDGRWVCRTFKAVVDEDSKKVLWPELNSFEDLMADKADSGSIVFNREMQNERWDEVSSIIKRHWLNGWEYDPSIKWANITRDFGPASPVKILGAKLGCDPSTGEKETGDPAGFAVVIETMGPGSRKDWWIEDLANEVLSFDGRLSKLEAMKSYHHGRYPDPAFTLRRALIETIGGFIDFGEQAKKKTGLPIELVKFVLGKKANLASHSGEFEFGKVHISKNIDPKLRTLLVDQLVTNDPDHDDLRDSVLLCLGNQTQDMKSWVSGSQG